MAIAKLKEESRIALAREKEEGKAAAEREKEEAALALLREKQKAENEAKVMEAKLKSLQDGMIQKQDSWGKERELLQKALTEAQNKIKEMSEQFARKEVEIREAVKQEVRLRM